MSCKHCNGCGCSHLETRHRLYPDTNLGGWRTSGLDTEGLMIWDDLKVGEHIAGFGGSITDYTTGLALEATAQVIVSFMARRTWSALINRAVPGLQVRDLILESRKVELDGIAYASTLRRVFANTNSGAGWQVAASAEQGGCDEPDVLVFYFRSLTATRSKWSGHLTRRVTSSCACEAKVCS